MLSKLRAAVDSKDFAMHIETCTLVSQSRGSCPKHPNLTACMSYSTKGARPSIRKCVVSAIHVAICNLQGSHCECGDFIEASYRRIRSTHIHTLLLSSLTKFGVTGPIKKILKSCSVNLLENARSWKMANGLPFCWNTSWATCAKVIEGTSREIYCQLLGPTHNPLQFTTS
jgi:hypothetical protein